MEKNILSMEIEEELAQRRKLAIIVGGLEWGPGVFGLGVTALGVVTGNYGVAVAAGIPTLYLFSDTVYTFKSLGERPFHLMQTILEKLMSSKTPIGHWKASDIEKMLLGESYEYKPLERRIAQPGDSFYTDCRVLGVIEEGRVIRADDAGFTCQFEWGGLARHLYGTKEKGILVKHPPGQKQEFYREVA